MNQFGVVGMQVHTQTHMNTHISLHRELLLPANPVPSTTSAGTWHWIQPQCSGLGCLGAGAAAGCSCPGLQGRQGLSTAASPEGRAVGSVGLVAHVPGGTRAGAVPWPGADTCPGGALGLLNASASSQVKSSRNSLSGAQASPAPSGRQHLSTGHCER